MMSNYTESAFDGDKLYNRVKTFLARRTIIQEQIVISILISRYNIIMILSVYDIPIIKAVSRRPKTVIILTVYDITERH